MQDVGELVAIVRWCMVIPWGSEEGRNDTGYFALLLYLNLGHSTP